MKTWPTCTLNCFPLKAQFLDALAISFTRDNSILEKKNAQKKREREKKGQNKKWNAMKNL